MRVDGRNADPTHSQEDLVRISRQTAAVTRAAATLVVVVAIAGCGSSGEEAEESTTTGETTSSQTSGEEETTAEQAESTSAEEPSPSESSEPAAEEAELVAVPKDDPDPIAQIPVPSDFTVVMVSEPGLDPATLSLQADGAEAVDYYETYFQGLGYTTQRDVTWTFGENSGTVELVFAGPGVYGSVSVVELTGTVEVWLRREPFNNGIHDGLTP